MKLSFRLSIASFGVLSLFASVPAQEFAVHSNGLIYDDQTLSKLKFIVDSLHVKFRECVIDKVYLSKPQTRGHYLELKDEDGRAQRDMGANVPFETFLKSHKPSLLVRDVLIVKSRYDSYHDKPVVAFETFPVREYYPDGLRFEDRPELYDARLKHKWLFRADGNGLTALYFADDFKSYPLPDLYARAVQYSDCLVDTNSAIFFVSSREAFRRGAMDPPAQVHRYLELVNDFPGKPESPEYPESDDSVAVEQFWQDWTVYTAEYARWDSLRLIQVDDRMRSNPELKALFLDAAKAAMVGNSAGEDFEFYLVRYGMKEEALHLKRNRRVIGMCSQDDSPRRHAQSIAMLAAETINWEVFLRAHLDIMNDRFDRLSDGSYAWAGRKTYIRELEELDIDVLQLMMGISLQIENPSTNHYFSDVGRALAESRYIDRVESAMLGAIRDTTLDDFNRLVIYYMFLNHNYNLRDPERRSVNGKKMAAAVMTMPKYIADKLVQGNEQN